MTTHRRGLPVQTLSIGENALHGGRLPGDADGLRGFLEPDVVERHHDEAQLSVCVRRHAPQGRHMADAGHTRHASRQTA